MQKKRKLCTLYEKNVNVRALWLYEIPKVPDGAGKGLQTGNDYGIFLPTSYHTAEVRGIRKKETVCRGTLEKPACTRVPKVQGAQALNLSGKRTEQRIRHGSEPAFPELLRKGSSFLVPGYGG